MSQTPAPLRRPRLLAVALACALWGGTLSAAWGQASREYRPDEPLETDRDSFTPAATVAGWGWTIFESSYSFINNSPRRDTHSYPEALVRYGISPKLELRIGWNFEAGGASNPISGYEFGDEDFGVGRESRMLFGLKYETSRQSGWIPQSSLLVETFTPTSGEEKVQTVNFGEIVGWQFPNGWRWDSAIRYSTAAIDSKHFDQWAPSSVLRMPVGERWTGHVEYFGVFSQGREREYATHFISFGPHYLLTPNLEIGVRVGYGLNDQSAKFFSNVGLGWRF